VHNLQGKICNTPLPRYARLHASSSERSPAVTCWVYNRKASSLSGLSRRRAHGRSPYW
jgi:hypothetical protein